MTLRYEFSFAWDSAYGNVVSLLKRLDLKRGAVLDLGCGVASIAEPVGELGYEYIGADIDRKALAKLAERGLEGQEIDLRKTDQLPSRMQELVGGRDMAAVLLLDVVEHLPETRQFMSALSAGLDLLGRPPLIVSVPNIAHVDVGAKLVFGRWDYRPTGLLDSTHLQFFTAERLSAEARRCGLLELDGNDFGLHSSDQHFPEVHPALSHASPVAQAIRAWRDIADPHGSTIQFIRAFARCDVEPRPEVAFEEEVAEWPLAVVMRTQGKRGDNLREALTCLAAQTIDTFQVMLMVHSTTREPALSDVKGVVEEFDPTFSSRVLVAHVAGGGRARPLNAALGLMKADYVAFLDDDDLVTADWAQTFLDAREDGVIVRSIGCVRQVSAGPESSIAPYVVESGLEFRYNAVFDPVHHLWGNETPICTFAVPHSLIEIGLRFDEQLPVLEDWDFLLKCVSLAGVRDTGKVTSIYQMWRSGESSASLHDASLWTATQRVVQDRSNLRPLVFPAGSAEGLIERSEQLACLEAVERERENARHEANVHMREVMRLGEQLADVQSALERVHRDYMTTITSRRWRVLGPPAYAVAMIRAVLSRLVARVARVGRRRRKAA